MKKTISIALAYVGVIVGAGFASGQEILQYFVSFGAVKGILALALAAFLFVTTGKFLLELGSLYNAKGHDQVINNLLPKPLAAVLDISFIVGNFGIGLVMIAGAGSNINQQFGLPIFVGSIIMGILIILAGFLNTEKVTQVIGTITPFLVVFFLVVAVYALLNIKISPDEMNAIAINKVSTTLPNWWMAAMNYVTFNLMTGVSMAIVMGGDELNPLPAGRGGFWGSTIISVLLLFSAGAMFSQIDLIYASDLPMLELVNQTHPILGTVMSVVILGMIFNTGLGMFYAVTSRLVKDNQKKFRITIILLVAAAFVLSFAGFKNLVAYLYPAIGYVGIVLLCVTYYGWFKHRSDIKDAIITRNRMTEIALKGEEATIEEKKEYEKLISDAFTDRQTLDEAVKQNVYRIQRSKNASVK